MKKVEVIDCEEVIPKKYRCFTFVLYDDSTSYNIDDILFNIKGYKYWVYIKHRPETDEKKNHYHVIIKLDNATSIEGISKRTGVPINYIQPVRNIRAICRYMIHLDDPLKIQYNYSDLKISKLFEKKFKKNFEELETETDIISKIYDFMSTLSNIEYYKAVSYLIIYVSENCYDTIYKRYRYEFLDYLKKLYGTTTI